jgi:hypothetical protein
MSATADLNTIIAELEMQVDFRSSYFNRTTGTMVRVDDDHFRCAEDDCDLSSYPEEEKADILLAREVFSSGRYIAMPSKYDIYEYSIMERYCRTRPDHIRRDLLLSAIQDKEAFQRFRAALQQNNLEEDWYTYRYQAFREIARLWCEANHIPYTDQKAQPPSHKTIA